MALLQGDESFKCEKCGEKTQATKRLRLFRLPKVLMLHIKRFKYSGSSREKLTNNVTFPIKVILSTYPPFRVRCLGDNMRLYPCL